MQNKSVLLIFLLSLRFCSIAQNETNNWYFGDKAGLDFTTNPPTCLLNNVMQSDEGCTTISDRAGNLLFYSDGETVYNRSNVVMANGSGLVGSNSTSQSSIVVKKMGNNNQYYLFTLADQSSTQRFVYSVIDMNLAAGMGSVTIKNVVLSDSCAEKLTAVRHCNGTDVWVLIYVPSLDQFRAFKVDGNGVNPVAVTSSGGAWPFLPLPQGCMKLSPNGKKLGVIDWPANNYAFKIYDFDNATGSVSNPLFILSDSVTYAYGCEFSPDGTKFYSSSNNFLLQWDLCAGSNSAIVASQTTVGSIPNLQLTNLFFATMQLTPNGKIYVAENLVSKIGVINNPNANGLACNFNSNGQVITSGYPGWGLPNFISSYFKQLPVFTYTLSTLSCNSMSFTAPPISNITPSCSAASLSYIGCKWVFGDPSSGTSNLSTLASPVHMFSNTGLYTVTLILYTTCGADTVRENIAVGCTGINQNGSEKDIRIFPNPIKENLSIDAQVPSNVLFFDMNGTLVLESKIAAGKNDINTSALMPGVYSLHIENDNSVLRMLLVKIE